ncbi:MAG: integrase, partial [Comamonas sp.]|nr:integrase [Comamonas sp.]
ALMLVRRNELDSRKSTYRCMIHQVIGQDIGNRISTKSETNLFRKYNFTEDDGSEILVTTHKFRHYLNTISQMNYIDQLDIARWSGRKNVSQNGYYDHVSTREITEKIRLAFLGEAAAIGPITNLHKVALVRRNEFALQKIPTAHTTNYGYCVHDYSMLPCQLHQDCMNCDEQVCIKGEGDCKEKNIRTLRSETELLLANAKESLGNDVYGADKWVRHQQLTLDRLNSLCSILDDPNVPDQAVIRLDDSLTQGVIEQAMERRAIDLMHDEDHE